MVLAGVTTLEEGFIAWLQERIAQRGLNQSEVGRRADVSKSMMSALVKGERNASRKMVLRLADALATDDESDEDRDNRRNSALLAAGFVPEGGGLPELTREPVDQAVHLYTGLSDEGRREASSYIRYLWDRERRRREGDAVEELEDEGDD